MILGNTRQIANIVAPEQIFGKQFFFGNFWLTDEDSDKKIALLCSPCNTSLRQHENQSINPRLDDRPLLFFYEEYLVVGTVNLTISSSPLKHTRIVFFHSTLMKN